MGQARQSGYPITLHLDSKTRTHIDEFSTSNFVALVNDPSSQKTVFVIPESVSILKSVTTMSLIELSKSFGWTVEIRPVPWEEVRVKLTLLSIGFQIRRGRCLWYSGCDHRMFTALLMLTISPSRVLRMEMPRLSLAMGRLDLDFCDSLKLSGPFKMEKLPINSSGCGLRTEWIVVFEFQNYYNKLTMSKTHIIMLF